LIGRNLCDYRCYERRRFGYRRIHAPLRREGWRCNDNAHWPHSALGYMTPEELASSHQGHAPDGMTASEEGAQYQQPELST